LDQLRGRPRSLYQYRPISGEKLGYLKSLLLGNELYLGSSARFNDPFDSKVDLDFSGAKPQDWREMFEKGVRLMQPGLSDSKLNAEVTKIMGRKHYQNPTRLQAVVADVQKNIHRVGVACFSEVPDSILMWSHYAESHSGVCVEFDNTDSKSVMAKALPVRYSSNYNAAKVFFDNEERQFELFLLTKSDCWSYEREWRICHFRGGVGVQELPVNAIRSIRLGCRIDSSVRETVLSWAKQRKMLALQANKSSSHYGLELETIE
jgi:hypothetical protein